MVNRVLIRLKVVQLLYSYMLSRSEFKVETPVETSSPDRRYSYEAYAELLLLLLELSGYKVVANRTTPPQVLAAISGARFADTKVARFLAANDDVRAIIANYGDRITAFDDAIPEVVAKLKAIPAYRTLSKIKANEVTPSDEIDFWKSAILAIAKLPSVGEALRSNPNFTNRGLDMATKMLVETLKTYSDTRNLLSTCKKDLQRSLDLAYDLYHWLLWLPVEIVRADEARLEANANKYLPTEEDLHPDRRFADSKLIEVIAAHEGMQHYIANKGINWNDDITLIPRLLDMILQSEYYKEYMATPGDKTLDDELNLWRKLMKHIILPSEDLAECLENRSIFWNDDIEVMSSFMLKTLRQLADDPNHALMPEFKDEEDAEFGKKLFSSAVTHREEYRALIDEFINVKRWDSERVALMDVIILITALAEAIDFPNIPLSVTTNEYVEIANWYSTARSGSFINGILATITDKLRKEGRIIKKFN